ncbi:hypothetical protein TNCV_178731 [Trichonephila clavipes]|nr:hypothetical protein TNCV_178731 [Trichonephila clavipes]
MSGKGTPRTIQEMETALLNEWDQLPHELMPYSKYDITQRGLFSCFFHKVSDSPFCVIVHHSVTPTVLSFRPNLLPDFSVLTHFTTATCSSITEIINSPVLPAKSGFGSQAGSYKRYVLGVSQDWIP